MYFLHIKIVFPLLACQSYLHVITITIIVVIIIVITTTPIVELQ